MRKTRVYPNKKQTVNNHGIEIEKKIEQLEWQRDNAMRIRCPLVARKYQRMIDELAKESRNKNMNKAEQTRQ